MLDFGRREIVRQTLVAADQTLNAFQQRSYTTLFVVQQRVSQLAVISAPNGQSHLVVACWASKGANFRFVRRHRLISPHQFHLATAPAGWQLR
jgi:hypothetical protein